MSEVELNEPQVGGYSVSLPSFEGPLDLLLHLCQKHELDILDIPIGFVTEKYLEYLSVMQLIDLDVASEYLVMAATLAHIKSKMLLPAPPPGQEDELAGDEEDPREALIRRLLEYQKYKQAGEELAGRGVSGRDVFLRGTPIEEAVHTGLPPLAQVPLFSLVEAFQGVLSKSKVKLSHDIVHERITLADRINELVDMLRQHGRLTFEAFFAGSMTRFDLVITFLAILEMTRLRMTRLFQADIDSQIYIEFTAQVAADEDVVADAAAAGFAVGGAAEATAAGAAGEEPAAGGEAATVEAGRFDTEPPSHAFDTEVPPAGTNAFDAFEESEGDASEGSFEATDLGSLSQTIPSPPLDMDASLDADASLDMDASFDVDASLARERMSDSIEDAAGAPEENASDNGELDEKRNGTRTEDPS